MNGYAWAYFVPAQHNFDDGLAGPGTWIGWENEGESGGWGGGSGSGINWQSIINQGFGIASQAIAGWSNNPTQQFGAGGSPIGQGYSPAAQLQAQAQLQAAIAQQQMYGNPRYQQQLQGGGLGLDDAAGSITGFITRNPLLVAGGVLGVYLLMREPPRRR